MKRLILRSLISVALSAASGNIAFASAPISTDKATGSNSVVECKYKKMAQESGLLDATAFQKPAQQNVRANKTANADKVSGSF